MYRLSTTPSLEQSAQQKKGKAMRKIKLKFLQIIGIVHMVVKESRSIRTFGGRIRLILLMIKRKAVTRAKRKEIKKYNFETAACWRDKEKVLLKQIKNCFKLRHILT